MVRSMPGLLAGLAALAIPVVIHLISRSRGRRVLIGNIALVRSARRRLVHQLRITQWPLLLVRLALLALAALILGRLAAPGLQELSGNTAYVTPAWLTATDRSVLTGLEGQYETIKVLAPGYPDPKDASIPDVPYDLWPLLAERLSVVHHAGEVHVYSTGRLGEFGALEPPLQQNITWHVAEAGSGAVAPPTPRVLVLGGTGQDPRTVAVEQALQAITRHRLPGLDWQLAPPDGAGPDPVYDAVIWCPEKAPPEAWRRTFTNARWIDLNDNPWRFDWQAAEFPQRLLEALLKPEQVLQNWSGAPIAIRREDQSANALVDLQQLPQRSLQTGLALILILLWGLERWLSERRVDARV
jgi:hypothetical protein